MATQHGSVLVTGSSSGIGRSTAIALAEAGFRVFAGVRKDADGYVLREATPHRRLIPVILDVTEDDQITAAATRIAELTHGAGLAGLVNNAGTALARPIEFVEIEALREQYEINVIGQVAVTQAMLPLLRAGRGRVINIGSAASWTTMPFAGVQCSVKHALRSVNDALRQELKPWSIPVILVEPGVIKTAAVDKLQADLDDALASLGVDGRSLYEESFRAMVASALRHEQHRGAP
ncbi:MAG TPA: SDR family NAD(P)-dependent oxidoreductase, partial [Mycobacterium sp.]|uniref:SDR family NAD(P)-dependent oxidoreductase n=1 Tax=Mycobacterium sp. TaxID=1785 RepID=UPI002D3045E2